jgi:acetolactate synthase-1/2/3 large subunit
MVDIIPMVKPITKWTKRLGLMAGEFVRINTEMAVDTCLSYRQGPVWLDVPLDVQAEEI